VVKNFEFHQTKKTLLSLPFVNEAMIIRQDTLLTPTDAV
jgi:hypothetical protein